MIIMKYKKSIKNILRFLRTFFTFNRDWGISFFSCVKGHGSVFSKNLWQLVWAVFWQPKMIKQQHSRDDNVYIFSIRIIEEESFQIIILIQKNFHKFLFSITEVLDLCILENFLHYFFSFYTFFNIVNI